MRQKQFLGLNFIQKMQSAPEADAETTLQDLSEKCCWCLFNNTTGTGLRAEARYSGSVESVDCSILQSYPPTSRSPVPAPSL